MAEQGKANDANNPFLLDSDVDYRFQLIGKGCKGMNHAGGGSTTFDFVGNSNMKLVHTRQLITSNLDRKTILNVKIECSKLNFVPQNTLARFYKL